jgi:hypothetical protein
MQTERDWRLSATEYLAMAERVEDRALKQRLVLMASHCLEMAEEARALGVAEPERPRRSS